MSSIAHIRATPGFPDGKWPTEMSAEQNLVDLVRHAGDFATRTGFTYSVLDGDEVIGCVYLCPTNDVEHDVEAQSWVRLAAPNSTWCCGRRCRRGWPRRGRSNARCTSRAVEWCSDSAQPSGRRRPRTTTRTGRSETPDPRKLLRNPAPLAIRHSDHGQPSHNAQICADHCVAEVLIGSAGVIGLTDALRDGRDPKRCVIQPAIPDVGIGCCRGCE